MSRYALSIRGRHIEVGWNAPRQTFFAQVEQGAGELQLAGPASRPTTSLSELVELIGELGPLPDGLIRRLEKDREASYAPTCEGTAATTRALARVPSAVPSLGVFSRTVPVGIHRSPSVPVERG